MKSTRRRFVRLGTLAPLMLSACATPSARPLTRLSVGVQSAKPDETRAAWTPLVQDMGRKLGVESQLTTASQADVVKALREGRVDVAWLSSSAAIDAAIDAQARAFALYINVNGTQGYKGVLVTRSDSGIRTLDDALTPGKYRYASGARTSTSGYLLPQHFLFNQRRTTPEALFKSVSYGSHFDNLAALWDGRVDVAVNNSTDLATFQSQRQPASQGRLVVLWESPLVPNDVLMFRADTPEPTKRALTEFFVRGYGRSEAEKALYRQASGIREFVAADNRLLLPVSEFKFATERAAIEGNAALGAADKAAALQALQRRVEAFSGSVPAR